jgi:DNA polymerase III alpha subunit (gram-positive type)
MGQQAVAEADRAVKAVEHVRGEYRKKVGESGDDKFKRERICEWVIDSCDRIAKETRE